MKPIRATIRRAAPLVLVGVLLGCGSAQFSLAAPPPLDADRFSQPSVPEPQPVKVDASAASDVTVVVHKTRDVPDLRGRLVALTRLNGDAGTALRLEDAMTLQFVDRGVARLIPGGALAQVTAGVDRAEAGTKGNNVKLTAPLGVLALVADASGADYVLYGDVAPGSKHEQRDVAFEVPAEQLEAYKAEYTQYVQALDASLARVGAACDEALTAYEHAMEHFRKKGGRPGPGKGAPSRALKAEQDYAQFREACQAKRESLETARRNAVLPEALVADPGQRKQTMSTDYTAVTAVLKVRDAKTDETFWIGRFEARGPDVETTVGKLAARMADELSSGWGSTPPPAQAEAPARTR